MAHTVLAWDAQSRRLLKQRLQVQALIHLRHVTKLVEVVLIPLHIVLDQILRSRIVKQLRKRRARLHTP